MDFTEAYPHTCSTVGAAARSGDLVALQSLVWNGKPVDVKDNRGWRPIHESAFNGYPGCLEFLLRQEGTDVDWTTFAEETAVLLAARQAQVECLRVLLGAGANVNITTNEGFSPLYEAVQVKDIDCVKILVKKGANVNCCIFTGYSPLHAAAESGFLQAVTFLVSHGAELDATEDNGLTPLFLAAHKGHVDCLRYMLRIARERGQQELLNKTAHDNATPLLIAAQEGHHDCVKILIEFGADPNIPVVDNKALALQYAIYKGNYRCFEMLLDVTDMGQFNRTFYDMHPLILALQQKDTRFIRGILRSTLDIHMALPFDSIQSASLDVFLSFIRPAEVGSVLCHIQPDWPLEAARLLLQAGLSPNVSAENQVPPLLVALWRKASRLCELLLKYGASPNIYLPRVCGNLTMNLAIRNCLEKMPTSGVVNFEAFRDIWTLLLAGGEANSVLGQSELEDGIHKSHMCFLHLLGEQMSSKVKHLLHLLLCFCHHVRLYPHTTADFTQTEIKELESSATSSHALAHLCRQQVLLYLGKMNHLNKPAVESLNLPSTVQDYLLTPNALCSGQLLGSTNSSNGPTPMIVEIQ